MHWERLMALRTALLSLAGITCITVAAFLFPDDDALGWLVLGLGLFLIEWLTGPNQEARR
jgi:hypothetical protein